MKTASIPSLRVDPKLRHAAESVLREGETLSSFVEQAIRAGIERRQFQDQFIARGLASRDEARESGEYYSAEIIRDDLDSMLAAAEAKVGSSGS